MSTITSSTKPTAAGIIPDSVPSALRAAVRACQHVDDNRRSTFPHCGGGNHHQIVPKAIRDLYGTMGFYRKTKKHAKQAVLVVNPSHLPPKSEAIDTFLNQVHLDKPKVLVYYYANCKSAKCFGLIDPGAIIRDNEGLKQMSIIHPKRAVDMSLAMDGESTKVQARESARVLAQNEVKEDLDKEACNRVRGVRYSWEMEDTGEDSDDDDGKDGKQSPTGKDGTHKEETSNLHLGNDSLLGDQVDEDYSCALDNHSEDDEGTVKQPMFEHQRKVLSPPSSLAEPRVLYTEKEQPTANANDDDQLGQDVIDKDDDAAKAAVAHVAVVTTDKDILEEEEQGICDDNENNENNTEKDEETVENDEGEKKNHVNGDADTGTSEGDGKKKKMGRFSVECSQAVICHEASLQAFTDSQSKTFNQILSKFKAVALKEKEALVKEHNNKMVALEKQHNDKMVELKEELTKQHNDKMVEQKEALAKQHNGMMAEQKETMEKLHNNNLKEQEDAMAKQYNDKVVALEKHHHDKMMEHDQTEQKLKCKIESLNSTVAKHVRVLNVEIASLCTTVDD